MKKIIKAETNVNMIDIDSRYVEDTLEYIAYSCGYHVEDSKDGTYTFRADSDTENMPVITTKRYYEERNGLGKIWFEPTMNFPAKLSSEVATYNDSFEYWMQKWMDAARLCTRLNESPYTEGMYDDE